MDKSKEHSIIFNYLVEPRWQINYSVEPIRLQGLDPTKKYQITELNLYPKSASPFRKSLVYTGDFLMKVGLNPDVAGGERASVVLELREVE